MSEVVLRRKFLKAADEFARRGDVTVAPAMVEAFLNLLAHTFRAPCTLSIGNDVSLKVAPILE
jgi:hypothetical protein